MKLKPEQVLEMQSKGLQLPEIEQIAKQRGYEMPDNRTGLQKAASIADTLFGGGKVGEAIGTEIARFKATPEGKKFIAPGPSAGEVAGSALQSAALFTPLGKLAGGLTAGARAVGISKGASAIGKISAGALAGGAFDVAQNLQEGKTGLSALKPGLGAGIGAAIPAVGVAKNVAQRFGHDTAPRVINSLIKPLQKDFSYGKNPGRAVAESKIIANDFDELITKIRETRQTTGQEIGALGRKLSTKPIVDIGDSLMPLDEAMRTAASQNNPMLLSRLANVKKAITTVMEPTVDDAGNIAIKEVGARQLRGLNFSEARDILGQIGDITQFTGNPSDDKIVNSALKRVYGAIKQTTLEAADATDKTLAGEFRRLTEKYADLSSAEVAAKYRDKILERSSLVGFSPQVAGIGTALITFAATGGATAPAILAGVTGAVLDKLASSSAFKTRLAAILSQQTPQVMNIIYQKVPALQKLFPKGSPISPGDYLLETEIGEKIGQEVKQSIKNPSLGLSIKDVSGVNKSLAAEARKYKSAEEFVKAQTPVFRGLESEVPANRLREGATAEYTGTAFSRQMEQAQKYGDLMLAKYIPEDKILMPKDVSPEILKNLRKEFNALDVTDADTISTERIISKVMNLAKQNNKDAADIAAFFKGMSEEAEVRVLNENALKTKSQLTDFYNKVMGKKK